jgi:hypothetical protein
VSRRTAAVLLLVSCAHKRLVILKIPKKCGFIEPNISGGPTPHDLQVFSDSAKCVWVLNPEEKLLGDEACELHPNEV